MATNIFHSRTGADHVCDQKSSSQILEAYVTEVIEYVRDVWPLGTQERYQQVTKQL